MRAINNRPYKWNHFPYLDYGFSLNNAFHFLLTTDKQGLTIVMSDNCRSGYQPLVSFGYGLFCPILRRIKKMICDKAIIAEKPPRQALPATPPKE